MGVTRKEPHCLRGELDSVDYEVFYKKISIHYSMQRININLNAILEMIISLLNLIYCSLFFNFVCYNLIELCGSCFILK
jgi:hypothetical protein